jgi:hypothetical protein
MPGRTTKHGLYRGIVAVVVLMVAVAARAQTSATVDPAALFAAARPALEEALGSRLDIAIECRSAGETELPQWNDPNVEAEVHWQFPELQGEALARAVDAARAATRSVTLAWRVPGQNKVLLCPDNAKKIASWDPSLAPVDSSGLLQLALVQEAARLVLEQRHNLAARRTACRDPEEHVAFQAVIEGRALALTRQTARRLGSESLLPLLLARYARAPESSTDPFLRVVCETTLRQRQRAGLQGLAFFDYLQSKGLTDIEAQVFQHPPRERDWLVHPERYWRARQDNRPDLVEIMTPLESFLPAPEWTAAQQAWTPAMLIQIAELFGERERADRVARRWEEGRSLMWTAKDHPNRQVGVGVIRFQDAPSAQAYFGFSADLHRKQDEATAKTPDSSYRILESKAQAVSLEGMDEATWTLKRIQLAGLAEPMQVSQIWARHGDVVVQFTWTDLASDAKWAERVVREIVARLTQSQAPRTAQRRGGGE